MKNNENNELKKKIDTKKTDIKKNTDSKKTTVTKEKENINEKIDAKEKVEKKNSVNVTKKAPIKKTVSQVKKITKKSEIKKTKAKKVIVRKKKRFNPEDIIAKIKPGKYSLDRGGSKKNKTILYFDKKIKMDIIDIFVLVLATSIITCLVSALIVSFYYKNNSIVYNSDLANDADLASFIDTYSSVVENFYEEVDRKGMIEAAKTGMMEHLADRYSIYLDKDNALTFEESINNMYEGIGILSTANVVYEVYPDSPAERAGMKAADVIIKVNGVSIDINNYDEISELIQNNDSENEIVVTRDGEELTFMVAKEKVYKPSVGTQVIEKNNKKIGYISLDTFTQKSYEEFKTGLYEMEEDNIDSLIIDLRGNSGGYMDAVNNIASMFLEDGSVIYTLEKKNSTTVIEDETVESRNYSIVVLVNGTTASASEILATALKDNFSNVVIVGTKTYGKGKVQTVIENEESIIKYTSSKWFRPNGECIDEVGIIPDYVVENEIKNSILYDKQYDKAVEILSKE